MNDQCIFCKLTQKKDSSIEFEDDQVVAFCDINPKAPVHILIVPKKHIESIRQLHIEDECLVGHMVDVAKNLAREKGISDSGYRLVFNVGKDSGQVVDHIHLHLLGGKPLGDIG